ncbi:MAG: hypothetical protein M3Q48_17435 [Actinomycetota bacterium]|nr:hypothetical protein [Actinomycetota bacterium]
MVGWRDEVTPGEVVELTSELQELSAELGRWHQAQELEALLELAFENYKARTVATEKAMRKHLQNKQWKVLNLPGRSWNSPGPDAVAFKNGSLLLLDNKAYLSPKAAGRPVKSATGLSAKSLAANLPALIAQLGAKPRTPPELLAQLQRTHAAAQAAVASGGAMKLPPKVQRVITNAGGQSPGVHAALKQSGMKFIDLARRMGLTPTKLGVT